MMHKYQISLYNYILGVGAATGYHAIAIITEWDLYRELDYRKIYSTMSKPAFIFDGRNILDHKACFDVGFNVYRVGKPSLTHFA